jgi:Mrp family chromosome partitioning ATPase
MFGLLRCLGAYSLELRLERLLVNIQVHDKSSIFISIDEPLFREMRVLLAGILSLIDRHGTVVLHLTAARGGDGTTTISRALAACAAQSKWCRVVLLDANLSMASEPDGANLPNIPLPGMVDVFAETGDVAIRRLDLGGAKLGIGRLNSSGPFMLKMDSVRTLYQRLRQDFTLIIVDAPPVLHAPEVAALAPLATGTMLVVASEETRYATVQRSRLILDQLGANILGVVLNKRQHRLPSVLSRLT